MIKQILILFLLLAVGFGSYADDKKDPTRKGNLPYFEKHRLHFGFTLGVNSGNFRVKTDLTAVDSLISLQVGSQSGFNIGIVSSYRFNEHFTFRFLPTLAFAQRNFNYLFENQPRNIAATRIIESTYIMFPLLFKFRSARYNNFAAYAIAGGNFAIDLASQFDVNNDVVIDAQVLKVQRNNYLGEVGAGFDFFLEYFKFSLEFKYSHGLNDIFVNDGSFWSEPIREIKPQMFSVSLHFEG